MRFRMGLVVGFAAGYVLGTKAGKERYEQIRRTADKVMGSEQVDRIRSTAVHAAGDVGQKAAEAVRQLRHRGEEAAEDVARRTEPLAPASGSMLPR